MICTFGDTTDVTWWRELNLELRAIIGRDGRLLPDAPHGVDAEAYALIAGKYPNQAQRAVVEQLVEQHILVGEPEAIQHPVKFYERGDRPLEIVTSRQWYIRNGGRDASLRDDLVGRGSQMTWYPGHMQHRYDNWVEGLNGCRSTRRPTCPTASAPTSGISPAASRETPTSWTRGRRRR